MIALAGSVLAAALLGSPHCVAMCGGFVGFVAGEDEGRRLRAQFGYHLGRLFAYAALGMTAGTLGAGLDRAGAAAGIGRLAAPLAGALMIAWGGAALAAALGWRVPRVPAGAALHRVAFATLRRWHARPPLERAVVMGLVTAFLPCGFLWAFVAIAAGAGSTAAGALVMAAFWIGTVPVMLGLGALAGAPLAWLRARAPLAGAALLLVFGALTMAGKLAPLGAAPTAVTCPRHAAPAAAVPDRP